MLRIPFLHLLALALCALALAAAPALAGPPPASVPVAAAATADDDEWDDDWDDDWEDDEDWDDECGTAEGELADEACADDGEPCFADGGGWDDDEEAAGADEWGDDDWEDDEDWGDEDCAGEADGDSAGAAAPRLTGLKATAARHGPVQIRFRLDRGSHVTLALRSVTAAAGRCTQTARAAKRRGAHRKARRCGRAPALRGTIDVAGRTGANATTLRRWKGKRLQPGRYRLTATPAATGGRGTTTTFKLRAARR